MEAIKISSFGRNEIQNAEWYATSIEELAATEGSCIGDKGYLLVENMPMYIKKSNSNNQEDWQFIGNKLGGSLPKPIPYSYMPEGYPKFDQEREFIYEWTDIPNLGPKITIYGPRLIDTYIKVPLVEGERYVVTVNDVEYICVCQSKQINEKFDYAVTWYIGNPYAIWGPGNEDTGEPFGIAQTNTWLELYTTAKNNEKNNYTVNRLLSVATPINSEFIPALPEGFPIYDPIGGRELVGSWTGETVANGVATIATLSADGMKSAIEVGETYIVIYNGEEFICECTNSKSRDRELGNSNIQVGAFYGPGPVSYPFRIRYSIRTKGYTFSSNKIEAFTVSIYKPVPLVVPIDMKFLPMDEIIAAVQAAMSTTE